MIRIAKVCLFVFLVPVVSACGSTQQFVAAPTVEMRDSTASLPGAVSELFVGRSLPYEIALCEADPLTGLCKDERSFPSATGLGGLFLPLNMELESIIVEQAAVEDGVVNIETKLSAPVNRRPSSCGQVPGRIEATATTASLYLPNNYCNWLVIGNVLQNIILSIDAINLQDNSFTGYYRILFFGTGNVRGSGYFRADLIAAPTR
ncbi:MAG: hypothetical protein QNJ14_06750 [Woeseiaceae bacterium]|nr:hypothetical protein [Woeseiaceae bacterium]